MKNNKTTKTLLSLLLVSPMVLGLTAFTSSTANARTTANSPVFKNATDYYNSTCSNNDELTGKIVLSSPEYYRSLLNNKEIITNLHLENESKGIYFGRTASSHNGVNIEAYYNAKTDTFFDVKAQIDIRNCSGFNRYSSLPATDQFGNKYKVEELYLTNQSMYKKDGSPADSEAFVEALSVPLSDKALKKYAKHGINLTLRTTMKDPSATPKQLVIIPSYLLQSFLSDFRNQGEALKKHHKKQGKKW